MANILVVDDHPDSREVLGEMLKLHGHKVVMADSGELAWETIRESLPDVAVLDQRMAGITGMELLKRIRGTPDLSRLRVVLCSADDSEREAAQAAGADGFWLKGSAGIFDAVALLSKQLHAG